MIKIIKIFFNIICKVCFCFRLLLNYLTYTIIHLLNKKVNRKTKNFLWKRFHRGGVVVWWCECIKKGVGGRINFFKNFSFFPISLWPIRHMTNFLIRLNLATSCSIRFLSLPSFQSTIFLFHPTIYSSRLDRLKFPLLLKTLRQVYLPSHTVFHYPSLLLQSSF